MRLRPTQKKVLRWGVPPLLASVAIAGLWGLRPAKARLPAPFRLEAQAPLLVGAAKRPLQLPALVTLAGGGLWRAQVPSAGGRLMARAVTIGPWDLVELDLLEIPLDLFEAVAARLPPGEVLWLVASHTHSGPGGYDRARLPTLVGARRFDPSVFASLVEAAVGAVAEARHQARPGTFEAGRAAHPELKVGRRGAVPDPTLAALRITDPQGKPIAVLVSFGAHPTMVGVSDRVLSGDWPAAAEDAIERNGGVALVMQGIGGDSSWNAEAAPLPAQLDGYGRAIAAAAGAALADATRWTATAPALTLQRGVVDLVWDPSELLGFSLPGLARSTGTVVQRARLGDLEFLCLPGEVTAAAWRQLPVGTATFPLTLCGDELSYIEAEGLPRGAGERFVLFPQAVSALARALTELRPR